MTFYTAFDRRPSDGVPVGDRKRNRYKKTLDEHGAPKLVVVEVFDQQDEIESFKDSTDISLILRRYEAGDPTALMQREGVYLNTLGMPSDIHQASKILGSAKEAYRTLDPELKKEYPSFDAFVSAFGDKSSIESFYKAAYERKKAATAGEVKHES